MEFVLVQPSPPPRVTLMVKFDYEEARQLSQDLRSPEYISAAGIRLLYLLEFEYLGKENC